MNCAIHFDYEFPSYGELQLKALTEKLSRFLKIAERNFSFEAVNGTDFHFYTIQTKEDFTKFNFRITPEKIYTLTFSNLTYEDGGYCLQCTFPEELIKDFPKTDRSKSSHRLVTQLPVGDGKKPNTINLKRMMDHFKGETITCQMRCRDISLRVYQAGKKDPWPYILSEAGEGEMRIFSKTERDGPEKPEKEKERLHLPAAGEGVRQEKLSKLKKHMGNIQVITNKLDKTIDKGKSRDILNELVKTETEMAKALGDLIIDVDKRTNRKPKEGQLDLPEGAGEHYIDPDAINLETEEGKDLQNDCWIFLPDILKDMSFEDLKDILDMKDPLRTEEQRFCVKAALNLSQPMYRNLPFIMKSREELQREKTGKEGSPVPDGGGGVCTVNQIPPGPNAKFHKQT